jgi:hypothetical protein
MATQANARILDAKAAQAIINSRLTITSKYVGEQVKLQIQGNGTFQSAKEQEERTPNQKAYFDKYIHNLKANSAEAMSRKENRELLEAALKAESTGDMATASELYNKYLNAIQLSFNVIAQAGKRKFADGDMVVCKIGTADTLAGHRAFTVSDVRYVAPVEVEQVKFDITALIASPAPTAEEVTAPVNVAG